MGNHYSIASLEQLNFCKLTLQRVFKGVLPHFDHRIIKGHRDKITQDKAFAAGTSKLKWPKGKHNALPSEAVDVEPWPIDRPQKTLTRDGKRWARYYYFGGFVLGYAMANGIRLRWGADWNGDKQLLDQTFDDLFHYELTK